MGLDVKLRALGYKEIPVIKGLRYRYKEDCEVVYLLAKNKNLILELVRNGIFYKSNIILPKHHEFYDIHADKNVNNSRDKIILNGEKSLFLLYDIKKVVFGDRVSEHEDFILIRDGKAKYIYMLHDDCTYELGREITDEEFNQVLYQKLYIRSIVGNKMYFGYELGTIYKFNCEKVDDKFVYDLVEIKK